MADGDKPASREPDEARDLIFKKELVQLIPHLRAFARTLTGDPTAADSMLARARAALRWAAAWRLASRSSASRRKERTD